MTSRAHLIVDFLEKNGYGNAHRYTIDGDASFRHYERLVDKNSGKSAMLMDAPPAHEDVRPFIKVAEFLHKNGFSSPKIFASDVKNGLLLLEDLGNNIYTRILNGSVAVEEFNIPDEKELYRLAIELLLKLHNTKVDIELPSYNIEKMLQEAMLLADWFLPNIDLGEGEAEIAKQEYSDIWKNLLTQNGLTKDVLVLRDYHADNLLWLPTRNGIEQVGLLDFQDAVMGSPIYDIVSLLEDARRNVDLLTVSYAIDFYMDNLTNVSRDAFMAEYCILAAQRNCKIVGIFARLAFRDNKPRYLDYLPRVWRYIKDDVQHPILEPLKNWLDKYVPENKRKAGAIKFAPLVQNQKTAKN